MATRTCPSCGTQYVATVRRCIDCDTTLVDDRAPERDEDPAPSSAAPLGDGDQVAYELEGWGNQLKVSLEGMLEGAGVRRVWEAGALVVSAADEATVDDLIATVEGDDLPDLDEDVPRVALEIEGLDADGHAELDARLIAGAVAHAWDDEGALIVAEADEDEVLAIVEEVLLGAEEGDDGLAAQRALSTLYVAVDRLVKDPTDRKLARSYVDAVGGLDGLAVPYGFATSAWEGLVADAGALADLVAAPPSTDGDADVDVDDAEGEEADAAGDAEDDGDGEPTAAPDDDADEGGGTADGGGEGPDDDATPADGPDRARAAAHDLRERLADIV